MRTKFVEAGNGFNWGKFMLAQFDREEWERRSNLPGYEYRRMLPDRGWGPHHTLIFDLQTGEGAIFLPGGSARADLSKHKVWVCPMFEPFLEWLYEWRRENGDWWFDGLPGYVDLPDAPSAMQGYRREGVPQ